MSGAPRCGAFRRRNGDVGTGARTPDRRDEPRSAAGSPDHWCPACGRAVDGFLPGPNRRPNAACPHCESLERHRFLAVLLEGLGPAISSGRAVLDIAPTPQIERVLRRLTDRYVRMDLDPAVNKRPVDVRASITKAPFADGAFDVILCYHVLEHVPDDASALRELRRLLSPGGFALVQVPWRPDAPTDEDPDAPANKRSRRFGQADHVRSYGYDFEQRLLAAGLDVTRLTPLEVLGEASVSALRLKGDESVWVLRRRDATPPTTPHGANPSPVRVPGDALCLSLARHIERQYDHIARLEQQLRTAERLAARYREIRQMLPVRIAAALTRPFRTVFGRASRLR